VPLFFKGDAKVIVFSLHTNTKWFFLKKVQFYGLGILANQEGEY
jgi:hypothetical protein